MIMCDVHQGLKGQRASFMLMVFGVAIPSLLLHDAYFSLIRILVICGILFHHYSNLSTRGTAH